jgi:hypothetical protein
VTSIEVGDMPSHEEVWSTAAARQLAAAIDMLENAIAAFPPGLWGDTTRQPQAWYVAYHTLFMLDYYMSATPDGFAPPEPFDLAELDPAGVVPPRVYTQDELRVYAAHCRRKVAARLAALAPPAPAGGPQPFYPPLANTVELVLMNLRHVQHHTAQLHLILRQEVGAVPPWVFAGVLPPLAEP